VGFLVAQCVASALLLAVGVMLLAVGSLVLGGVVCVGALVWGLLTLRRM
jgi:hypothetical protein